MTNLLVKSWEFIDSLLRPITEPLADALASRELRFLVGCILWGTCIFVLFEQPISELLLNYVVGAVLSGGAALLMLSLTD